MAHRRLQKLENKVMILKKRVDELQPYKDRYNELARLYYSSKSEKIVYRKLKQFEDEDYEESQSTTSANEKRPGEADI